MKTALRSFLIPLLILSCFCSSLARAGDACNEVMALRAARLRYDIDIRKERLRIRRDIARTYSEINDLEGKMIGVKQRLLTMPEETHDPIWKEYDNLDEKQTALWKKLDGLNAEHSKIDIERSVKRFEMRKDELSKSYECIINKPLGEKLESIENRLKSEQSKDYEKFEKLLAKRNAIIQRLKAEYEGQEKLVSEKILSIKALQATIVDTEKKLKGAESSNNQTYDDVYNAISNAKEHLRLYRDEIKDISKQLIGLLDSIDEN